MRKTKFGSPIKDWFYPNVAGGESMTLLQKLFSQGYREIYYTAPYHWGVFNPDKNSIITYTEGDVSEVKAPDKKTFHKEIRNYAEWAKARNMLDEETTDYLKRIRRR